MKCSGVVSPAGVPDAFVETFMDMDPDVCDVALQPRSVLPQLTTSPRKTAPTAISLEHLRESMVKILLLFGHNDSQVLSHHMLRSALLGGPNSMRHQQSKSVLEISLLALVEAKYLTRHGFGSWAVYTANPSAWPASSPAWISSAALSNPHHQQLLLEKPIKVARIVLATRVPTVGVRRARSPVTGSLSGSGAAKRRKGMVGQVV